MPQRLIALMLVMASLWFGHNEARAQSVDAGHAVAELIAERSTTVPGDSFKAALSLTLDDGWHVYWKNPGDSGLPPHIEWHAVSGSEFSEFYWPAPHEQPLDGLMNYGYEERLVLPFDVQVPEGFRGTNLVLTGLAEWLICLDICIPEEAELTLTIPVSGVPEANIKGGSAIEEALQSVPTPIMGEARISRTTNAEWKLSLTDADVLNVIDGGVSSLRFFPDDHQILHPPLQAASRGGEGVSLKLQPAPGLTGDGALSGVLVAETADGARTGWRLSAVPGDPLSGTSGQAVVTTSASSGPNWFVLLLLAFIGGLVLNLMPCVLPVLSIKAMGLVQSAAHGEVAHLREHGLFYTLGVLVCFAVIGIALAALLAAGQQAGLGFQLQYPPVVAALALLMFLIGLNMMGMFEIGSSVAGVGSGLASKSGNTGAFFTGALAAIVGAPCVGPFLGAALGAVIGQPMLVIITVFLVMGLGMASPFLVLSFSPALSRLLPRPGAWMETLRQVLAFPLFLTAIWLLWVMDGLSGSGGVLATIFGAFVLTFAIWIWQKSNGAGVGQVIGRGLAVIAFAFGIAVPVVGANISAPAAVKADTVTATLSTEAWSPERVDALLADGKSVFVDFTARWCVTCQLNKRTTLQNARVIEAFNANDVVLLVADWTNRDDVIGAELQKHGRAGVPLYLHYPKGVREPEILPQILRPDMLITAVAEK